MLTTANLPQRHASRVAAVRELVATRVMTSQQAIVEALLERYGTTARISTVSRDLDELGAVLVVQADGQGAYRLPEEFTRGEVAPLILVAPSAARASALVARLREAATTSEAVATLA